MRQPNTRNTLDTRKDVLARILVKIDGTTGKPSKAESFLNEYYAALRAHLEQRALRGDRRPDKHETAAHRA